jgi:tol-pal system protein YbgF
MKRGLILNLSVCFILVLSSAKAGTKEDIERLQNDVIAVQNQIREFDRSFNEKTDGLKSLVVQLNDQVAQSNLILDRVSKTLETQTAKTLSNEQVLLQEIRNLSGKMDESETRISALARQVEDLRVQAKSIAQEPNTGGIIPQRSVYDQACSDYIQGNFDLAIQGFTDYLRNNPAPERVAAAQYYLGDAYSYQGKLQEAIASFTLVISDYPDAEQIAPAYYKRGKTYLAIQEKESAIADFRMVIKRFPTVPEAALARDQLRRLDINDTEPMPKTEGTHRKSR